MRALKRALVTTMVLGSVFAAPVGAADSNSAKQLSENTLFLVEPGGLPLGDLEPGTELSILQQDGDWAKVSITGWVNTSHLSDVAPKTAGAPGEAARVDQANPAAQQKPPVTSLPSGLADSVRYIGRGFSTRNIAFLEGAAGVTKVRGDVRNESGKNFSTAILKVTAFDRNRAVVGIGHALVSNLRSGASKSFECLFDRPIPNEFAYRIDFEYGF